MAKTLKERKEELKNVWESIFEKKIEEALTEKGLAKFWDENTSFDMAGNMLDKAAILESLGNLTVGDIEGVIIIEKRVCDDDTDEVTVPYEVERVADHYFYEEKFETEEDAKEFIRNTAMETEYKVSDFRVVKVCE